MIRARVCRPLLAAVAAILAAGASPAIAGAAPLPVRYGPLPMLTGGFTPDVVAGANDFTCRPTAEHPNPVVLVHGLSATLGDNWATMAPLLKNNGFCVFGLTYGRQPGFAYVGGLKRMEDSSQELAALVDKVLAATGAKRVDLVGHSEGTVMPRWYLSFRGGAPKVDKYVQLTPLWDGTNLAGIGNLLAAGRAAGLEPAVYQAFAGLGCGSCPQFARGSAYMNAVNAAGRSIPSITYTNIVTKYDELVIPHTSGFLTAPNVRNILLQDVCAKDLSEHLAVAYSPVVAQLMLNALDPARARPAACTTVTALGTPSPPEVALGPKQDTAPAVTPAATRCRTGRALTLGLGQYLRRGERVRSVTAHAGSRRLAARRGRALRTLRVPGLRPGRRTVRLRMVTTRGARTVSIKRTVRCAPAR